MNPCDWSQIWHHNRLNITLLQARYVAHAYPRHSHDYYVIALVDQGVQSFMCAGHTYVTPAGGLILLNPGEVHTGEPVDEVGFHYRALYPSVEQIAMATHALGRDAASVPQFITPRLDDQRMARLVGQLHTLLVKDHDSLQSDSVFLVTLVELVKRIGNRTPAGPNIGCEHNAIRKACDYIHEHYAQGVSLTELAEHVHFSPYYFLRTFRNAVGMPPHSYLESVRIRHAQRLLAMGKPLAYVAHQVGFSSQGHFTRRFKQIIGVTPGQYAAQVRS